MKKWFVLLLTILLVIAAGSASRPDGIVLRRRFLADAAGQFFQSIGCLFG